MINTFKIINLIILLTIIIYPNVKFSKELKKIKKNNFKYKLIFASVSLIIPFGILLIIANLMISHFLRNLVNQDVYYNQYTFTLIIPAIIFPTTILGILYFAKFYLKIISNTKTKNEIEIIGKE